VAFLFTFMAARVLVFLIVSRRIPDLYLNLGGTHVHHLNYGIFLLSAVGAYLLLGSPGQRALRGSAILCGIGLALTFDEFGLWLHLGGSYWQRASFDAVVVITGVPSLAAVAPAWLLALRRSTLASDPDCRAVSASRSVMRGSGDEFACGQR
jgi:hypothetical protein